MSDNEEDNAGMFYAKPQKPGGLMIDVDLPGWAVTTAGIVDQDAGFLSPEEEVAKLDAFFDVPRVGEQEVIPGISFLLKGTDTQKILANQIHRYAPAYTSAQVLEFCKQDNEMAAELEAFFESSSEGVILSTLGWEKFVLLFNGYTSAGPDVPLEVSIPVFSLEASEGLTFNFDSVSSEATEHSFSISVLGNSLGGGRKASLSMHAPVEGITESFQAHIIALLAARPFRNSHGNVVYIVSVKRLIGPANIYGESSTMYQEQPSFGEGYLMACAGGDVAGPSSHSTILDFQNGYWARFATKFDIPGAAFGDFSLSSRSTLSRSFRLAIKSPESRDYRVFGASENSINVRINRWNN